MARPAAWQNTTPDRFAGGEINPREWEAFEKGNANIRPICGP